MEKTRISLKDVISLARWGVSRRQERYWVDQNPVTGFNITRNLEGGEAFDGTTLFLPHEALMTHEFMAINTIKDPITGFREVFKYAIRYGKKLEYEGGSRVPKVFSRVDSREGLPLSTFIKTKLPI